MQQMQQIGQSHRLEPLDNYNHSQAESINTLMTTEIASFPTAFDPPYSQLQYIKQKYNKCIRKSIKNDSDVNETTS